MDINSATARELSLREQTNMFIKGMNTDTSDALLDNQQYRSAENIRIITNTDNNTGEARLIEGNKQIPIWILNSDGYETELVLDENNNTITVNKELSIGDVLVFDSIRDVVVLVDRKKIDGEYKWRVYKISVKEDHAEAELIFGPCKHDIWPTDWNGKDKVISDVLRWESDNNIKLYLANGMEQIMVLPLTLNFIGDDFESAFEYQKVLLPPPVTLVSDRVGQLKAAVVQYAYRMYKENGSATTISVLSKPLSLYKDALTGYAKDKRTNKAVKLLIDKQDSVNRILIYRITYVQIGLLPTVDIIYDTDVPETQNDIYEIIDFGYSVIKTISAQEFLSSYNLGIKPYQIESKGNYLFAANVSYTLDDVDEKFKNFDVTTTSYVRYNNSTELKDEDYILIHSKLDADKIAYLKKPYPLDQNEYTYDGIGQNLVWEFVTEESNIYDIENQNISYNFGVNNPEGKTYKSGETYRFGIRLFDENGQASSVKHICDIKIPGENILLYDDFSKTIQTPDGPSDNSYKKYVQAKVTSIKFTPINILNWKTFKITGYEIVRCERTLLDKSAITQGITGYVQKTSFVSRDNSDLEYSETDYLTPVGFLSLERIYNWHLDSDPNGDGHQNYGGYYIYDNDNAMYSLPCDNILLFASPECVYQPDDVKDILKLKSDNLYLTIDKNYIPYSEPSCDYTSKSGYGSSTHSITAYENEGTKYNGWSDSITIRTGADDVIGGINVFVKSAVTRNHAVPYALSVVIPNNGLSNNVITNTFGTVPISSENTALWAGSGGEYYSINPATAIYNRGAVKWDIAYNFYESIVDYNLRYFTDTDELYNTTTYEPNEVETMRFLKRNDVFPTRDNNSLFYTHLENIANGTTLHFLNHIIPARVSKEVGSTPNQNILSTAFAESPEYSGYAKNGVFTFKDNITAIKNKSFVNWTNPFIVSEKNPEFLEELKNTTQSEDPVQIESYDNRGGQTAAYPIGSGGRAILLEIENNYTSDKRIVLGHKNMLSIEGVAGGYPADVPTISNDRDLVNFGWTLFDVDPLPIFRLPMISVATIRQDVLPYGGYNDVAIKNSIYRSIGAFSKIDDNADCSVTTYGDSFIRMFTYSAAHEWYDPKFTRYVKMATVYTVPVETDIDLKALHSDALYGVTSWDYRVLTKASSFAGYSLKDDAYLYNTAYNTVADITTWSSNNQSKGSTNNYDTRVHYSQPKTNNEFIDNWTQFKAVDFIDVDTRYGEITALLLFKDKLIFWQDNATGLLSVNERTLLKDQNDNSIILGLGNVLERFDYFSTIYGQKKNEHNQTHSDASLYWWDGNNREILVLANGSSITPLSSVKQIKNWINNNVTTNVPKLMYDLKYKEVVCNIGASKSIVYNEQVEQFSSIYTYCPLWYASISGLNYTLNDSKLFKEDELNSGSSLLFNNPAFPKIQYVVNQSPKYNKTFDIQTMGGRFYGGDHDEINDKLRNLSFIYKTPLKQEGHATGSDMTNVEYDFRLTIPRAGYIYHNETLNTDEWKVSDWGDRLRGKTMQCEIKSDSNNLDFSLQYVITKFRTSWT